MINNSKSGIYLDYQATTPLDLRVFEAMKPYMLEEFGNPHSSDHSYGWNAAKAVDDSREAITSFINALENEIIFTSGATESNNQAIVGTGYAALEKSKKRTILISSIEHKCVIGAARFLEKFGFNIVKIPVLKNGIINIAQLLMLINKDVLLISVMFTNNEIGVNQPIKEIGKICRDNNIIFHVDAAQGLYENLNVVDNCIDLMSLSAHKAYGPKGIGALFINQDLKIKPLPIIYGGGQQEGYRSGTLPTHLIAGFAEAIRIMEREKEDEKVRLISLRNKLLSGLKKQIPEIVVNGSIKKRHPGNINIHIPNIDARQLIMSLQPHLAFSTGSACTSGITEPSHVLKALGLSTQQAEESFRITVGRYTSEKDIDLAINLISTTVEKKRL